MIFLALALLQGKQAHEATRERAEPHFFAQRLDHLHFNKDFVTMWQQRYFVNDYFYQEDADTMIIEIGGEGEIGSAPGGSPERPDVFGKIAAAHHAKLFALEHRYYGPSKPTESDSNENLKKYLNSRQAIADMMNFIDAMDGQLCKTTRVPGKHCFKWIIIGGSYPGALVGWITYKHQFAFAASVSSSGVVRAVHSLPEFDYQVYKASGTPCANAYQIAMREIEEAMESGDEWPRIYLGIPKDEFWNLQDFYWYLADSSVMVQQYGSWNSFCPYISDTYREQGNVTLFFLRYLVKHGYQYNIYSRELIRTQYSTSREWWFQMCTEVGYFQPAPKFNSIRAKSLDLQYHYDVCAYAFDMNFTGEGYDQMFTRTNNWYGSGEVYGPDTFFSNFWQDVWHDCGITAPTANAPNVAYVRCRDCGHCCDLYTDNDSDPAPLREVRAREVEFMEQKLASYRKE